MMVKTSLLVACGFLLAGTATARKRNYIVHMMPTEASTPGTLVKRQSDIESSLKAATVDPAAILYTYGTSLYGFAAALTDAEVEAMNSQAGVLSVRVERVLKLHTTRTPSFLGLADSEELLGMISVDYSTTSGISRDAAEANIIIAVLDTGAWPENPSHDDTGMPEIPSHWKRSCEEGENWTTANCNKKHIGAAAFYKGYVSAVKEETGLPVNWTGQFKSARGTDGHGTHTSTTAGGSPVANVSLFGQASGTARGMAKDARLATYKICWISGCYESDILAAMDRAIMDGVNVISGSFGGDPDFVEDSGILTGSFAAMEKGIFTSFSAGNSGPAPWTASNNAPWLLTVGASTLDRDFPAKVILGAGSEFVGTTLYNNGAVPGLEPLTSSDFLPLILSSGAGSNATAATLCLAGSLDTKLVTGKIIVCTRGSNGRVEKGGVVKDAGGRGMVLVNSLTSGEEILSDPHVLPAVHLGAKDGAAILKYAKSGEGYAAFDFEGDRLGVPAPLMAAFSSRGPNLPIPQIMKPDITGPGVSILAGWTRFSSPSGIESDTRRVDYNVISGTSMSAPHLSGIAAYIMARRPEWSIAAVRSALMTTAYTTTKGIQSALLDSATLGSATPFDYGNGHVDPVAALDPGLIYDVTADDYKEFICSVNSTQAFLMALTRSNYTCDPMKTYSPYDLNYPSFAAYYDSAISNGTYTAMFPRTLTNFGEAGTYTASVSVADKSLVKVTVEPEMLVFDEVGDTQEFTVTVEMNQPYVTTDFNFSSSHGRLEWTDGKHRVSSSLGFIWD